MISIKKDLDITLLVLAFFVLSFFVFIFMKPQFTGMVVFNDFTIQTIYTGNTINKSDTAILTFDPNEILSCASLVQINISDSSQRQIFLDTKTFADFINGDDKHLPCVDPFNAGGVGATIKSNISIVFPTIGSFSNIGSYTLALNLSETDQQTDYKTASFQVNQVPSDTAKPQITNVNFQNENGSSKFMITQKVNCSATVTDTDSSSVSVNYIMWGSNISKTSIANPGKSGELYCTGDLITGKTCSVSVNVAKSDLGYWNCTIDANDGTNRNYANSSVLSMINSPPRLKDEIDNITWEENENYTNLDLDSKFEDPDGQALNYTSYNNDHIDITIKTNGDVIFSPEANWTGTENIYFKARDEKSAEVKSNNFSLIVTNLFNCASSWICGNWSVCVNNIRTRTCTDINNCTVKTSYQPISDNCTSTIASCAANDGCMLDCFGGDSDCSCSVQNGYICGSSQNCTSTITHSGIGTCCSVPCSQSINTLTNAGEGGGFFSEQKNKILIGFGTIIGVVFVIILILVISSYLKKKSAGAPEETHLFQETVKEEKPVETSPVKIKPTNIDKMKNYIEQSLSTKVPIRMIKGELSKVGWTESDVDRELNTARLRNYIQIKLNQGIPRAQIEQSLRMKGWPQEQIDEASKNTKVRPLI